MELLVPRCSERLKKAREELVYVRIILVTTRGSDDVEDV